LATSQSTVSPILGCADNGLVALRRHCFYLALLTGGLILLISFILASFPVNDKAAAPCLKAMRYTTASPDAPCTVPRALAHTTVRSPSSAKTDSTI